MDSQGKKLHEQAGHAREAGEHLKALQLTDEALLAYQKENNSAGFAEVLADRSIVFRHLAEETEDQNFLKLAKAEMETSVQIARDSGDKTTLAIPLYQLGNVLEDLSLFNEAVNAYREAIENMENNPPPANNRPGVLYSMKVHLATCEYKTGDKSALNRAEQALSELESAEEEKYNKDVWVSGGYMRLADMLREDDPQKAKEHLQKAKTIIEGNPDLKLRKVQWDKLSVTF